MKYYLKSFLLPWLVFLSPVILGQNDFPKPLQFDHLEMPGQVHDVIRDRTGFLWISTGGRVHRYDGYEFKSFPNKKQLRDSIHFQWVSTLYEDKQGMIWVNNQGKNGFFMINPFTEEIHHFEYNFPGQDVETNDLIETCFYEDEHDKMWIGTDKGLVRFDRDHQEFKMYTSEGSTNYVRDIIGYKSMMLLLATGNQVKKDTLYVFDTQTEEFSYISLPKFDRDRPIVVDDLMEDNGKVWMGTTYGIFRLDPENDLITRYNPTFEQLPTIVYGEQVLRAQSISKNQDGKFLIVERDGTLVKFDHNQQTYTRYSNNLFDPKTISANVEKIYADNQGISWITSSKGLDILDTNKPPIYVFRNYLETVSNLKDFLILSVHLDDHDNVWLGTASRGLIKYNIPTGNTNVYLTQSRESKQVSHIFENDDGILWISTMGGFYKFDPKTNSKKWYSPDLHGIINVHRIFEDSNEDLWVVRRGYYDVYKFKTDRKPGFTKEISSFEKVEDLTFSASGFMKEDGEGNLWIPKQFGLVRYNLSSGNFRHFDFSFTNQWYWSVFFGKHGNLWLPTENGLFKGTYFSDEKDSIILEKLSIGPEFESIPIHMAGEDNQGNLYLTTGDNVIIYNHIKDSTEVIHQEEGLDIGNFSDGRIYRDEIAVTGGEFGFFIMNINDLKTNARVPQVVLTDFLLSNKSITVGDSLNGKPVLTKSITYSKDITLPHGQNFTLEFAALNFTNPSQNQYSYKLEGFDEEWSPPGETRTATYTNLWEGEYTFQVKGSNNDGVWNEQGASIQITILPPWYRGKIAWIIYGGLLVTALVYARKLIVQREREKAQLQMEHMELEKAHEMDRMKTQFFTNVSHEFRTPLTLILGPLKQMYEGTFKGDVHAVMGVMLRNSKRLLHLINQLLDFSRLESGAVTLQASVGDLVEFARTMFATFESTARSRKIDYVFQSNVSSLPSYYDRDKLEKVIINLLSNAFKFTKNGGSIKLTMATSIEDSRIDQGEGVVQIRIEDNGPGIESDKLPHIFDRFYQADPTATRQQEGTGIGLALAKELVELHYGTIWATSKKGEGTAFIIELPLGGSHLEDSEVVVRKGYQSIDTTSLEALPQETTLPLESNQDESLPLVLIIEDNEDMRLYLREVLSENYRLVEAANGQEGLESTLEQMPDLVLSDVMMPKMDGQELCQKLKTDERTSHIPIVLLTARAGEEAKVEGLETGADDYITKPFSPVELKARVQNLIELRQKLREQFSQGVSLDPKDVAITSADQRFLQRAMDIMEIHRSDADFNAEAFIKEIGMSKTNLHRKLKALTNLSASEFIRSYRLKYARQLIEKEFGNMAQVAYESGFNSPSYFAECFKKQFGVLPSEFAKAKF